MTRAEYPQVAAPYEPLILSRSIRFKDQRSNALNPTRLRDGEVVQAILEARRRPNGAWAPSGENKSTGITGV